MSEEIEIKPAQLPDKNQELDYLTAQLKEKDDKLLRTLADFDNYKKRIALDQDQFIKFANEGIVKELLPTLDGISKALEHSTDEQLTIGLELVKKQMGDALARFGVSEIEAIGKDYDPNFHEAIMKKESKEKENTIIEEVQKGYILNGRVIRPSMVIVSK
jgi:molecular chaperone GrpE